MKYPPNAVARAKDGALEWLQGDPDGYPRSWSQEEANTVRRGYELYDDFEAPPIAGYEELEREGVVTRIGTAVSEHGEQSVHFRLSAAAH